MSFRVDRCALLYGDVTVMLEVLFVVDGDSSRFLACQVSKYYVSLICPPKMPLRVGCAGFLHFTQGFKLHCCLSFAIVCRVASLFLIHQFPIYKILIRNCANNCSTGDETFFLFLH